MKITEKHLELNPDLNDSYKVGDEVNFTQGDPKPLCNSNSPTDPHHGQAGSYDKDCNWIPDIG